MNKFLEAVVFNTVCNTDGNATLVRTSTGTWSIAYNAQNRPVSFRNDATDTLVECAYDYRGRRCTKKVTVAGTVTLHQRYIYREYLQIACVDLTRAAHPALWFVLWDPTQPTATRPLAIQKDGSWFTYGHDITKNEWEVFGPSGYVRTSYDYAPFGAVTASGDVTQPFQWSSEFYDSELGLVYYNYRHYSPSDGRWLSRDPIEEEGGRNLYAFIGNNPIFFVEYRGNIAIVAIPVVAIGIIAIGIIGAIIMQPSTGEILAPEIPDSTIVDSNVVLCTCVLTCLAKGLSVAQDIADTCKRADPGDCTEEQKNKLQEDVKKTKGAKKCTLWDNLETLLDKRRAWLSHATARSIINNTCYKGGDEGHQKQEAAAWSNVGKCEKYILKKTSTMA